jgi:Uma2 family endonuclease
MPIRTVPPDEVLEMTEDEYLAYEAEAEYKSEYRQGKVYAMSGGTVNHSMINANVLGSLWQQLRSKPCKVFGGNMRAKVAAAGLYTYPDVMVVCGKTALDAKDKHAVTNPKVIVEVLSRSTAAYDRGEKFDYFKKLDSLDTYVLVSQNEVKVECFTRSEKDWLMRELVSLDGALELESIGCRVPLHEIYEKVDFLSQDEPDEH